MQYIYGENEKILQAFKEGLLPEDSIILTKEAGNILNLCYYDHDSAQFKKDLMAYDNTKYGLTPEVDGLAIIDAAKSDFLHKHLTVKTVPGYKMTTPEGATTIVLAGQYYDEDDLNEYEDLQLTPEEEAERDENVNKVVFAGNTLIDLSADTVTSDTLLVGTIAHDKNGKIITGTVENLSNIGTATATDILEGKTALVQGETIVGTMVDNSAHLTNNEIQITDLTTLTNLSLSGFFNATTLNFGNLLEDLEPENILSGTSILGVEGTLVPNVNILLDDPITVTPTLIEQTISPSSGHDGLSEVTVEPIPIQVTGSTLEIEIQDLTIENAINKISVNNTTILDLSQDTVSSESLLEGSTAHDSSGALITGTAEIIPDGLTALASNLYAGVTAIGADKTQITGTMPVHFPQNVTGFTKADFQNAELNGYYEGSLQGLAALTSDHIVRGVTILGVEGSADYSITSPSEQISIKPKAETRIERVVDNSTVSIEPFLTIANNTNPSGGKNYFIGWNNNTGAALNYLPNETTTSFDDEINAIILGVSNLKNGTDIGYKKLVDFSSATVTEDTLPNGIVAFGQYGKKIIGRAPVAPDGTMRTQGYYLTTETAPNSGNFITQMFTLQTGKYYEIIAAYTRPQEVNIINAAEVAM